MTGRVVKGIGGFYYVRDGGITRMGTARGNLKRNKALIYVGDIVDYDVLDNGECIINEVKERNSYLKRPPVSNLEMLVVVFAAANPEVNYPVVDKLIAACEAKGIEVAVCISKEDLVSEEVIREHIATYENVYPTVSINGITGEGIDNLRDIIRGRNVALAGPSGVGKSTIINNLTGGLTAETGSVSDKTNRGKHTTRHVEIFDLDDGTSVYDTPGFTSLDLPEMEIAQIKDLFPEFRALRGECRYSDCVHIGEPECAVKAALSAGNISRTRYDSYVMMTEEAKKWRK